MPAARATPMSIAFHAILFCDQPSKLIRLLHTLKQFTTTMMQTLSVVVVVVVAK
jgi:hypothetical protein